MRERKRERTGQERENEKRFSKELSLVQHDYWTHKEDKKLFLS